MLDIQSELVKHQQTATDKGHIVFGTYLQGSQNYGLEAPESDIDTKTIVIPKLDEIILNKKPVSTTHILEDNSHDDQKDIRLMFSTFHKQNINFTEILFTEHFIVNPVFEKENNKLMSMAESIANINHNQLYRCIVGMSYEKFKALEHPYPTTIHKIEKYGYDPKQLHHIVRLNEFIKRFTEGESFRNCLKSIDCDYLKEIKYGCYDLDKARILAKHSVEDTNKIREKFTIEKDVVNQEVIEDMNKLLSEIVKKSFVSELLK